MPAASYLQMESKDKEGGGSARRGGRGADGGGGGANGGGADEGGGGANEGGREADEGGRRAGWFSGTKDKNWRQIFVFCLYISLWMVLHDAATKGSERTGHTINVTGPPVRGVEPVASILKACGAVIYHT